MDTITIPFITLLLWGIIWFCVSILAMVMMFGLAGKTFLHDGKKIAVWLVLSMSLPFTLSLLTQKTQVFVSAQTQPKITWTEVAPLDNQVIINITTDRPALVYLEYWDSQHTFWIPLLPTVNLNFTTDHSFLTSAAVLSGKMQVNINGQRIPFNPK
jgi:hypothetical protein